MLRRRPDRREAAPIEQGALHRFGSLLLLAEHAIYAALGAALVITAFMVLVGTGFSLFRVLVGGIARWEMDDGLFSIIDQLLYVLMLAEIIYTVRVTLGSGQLRAEPFLIVGLIATIRRVLVITLTHSQIEPGSPEGEAAFRHSMTELAVLGGLILVLVVSIYGLRRSGRRSFAVRPSAVPEAETGVTQSVHNPEIRAN